MTENRHNERTELTDTGRRRLLNRLWTFLAALACIEFGWLSVRLLRSSGKAAMGESSEKIIQVGRVEDFAPSSVTAIPKGQFYLVCLENGEFMALSRLCTHLGCATTWDNELGRFVCPCHGSSFDMAGRVLTPPAVKDMRSHPLRVENGAILVDLTKTQPASARARADGPMAAGA